MCPAGRKRQSKGGNPATMGMRSYPPVDIIVRFHSTPRNGISGFTPKKGVFMLVR